MAIPRVIPVLLLRKKGLVKTVKFHDQKYIGDPFNAVKIFNEKGVDELIFLDIDASKERREPPYEYLAEIASECFMPLGYGGGVSRVEEIKRLIQSGIEKIVINHQALENPEFVKQATQMFGSSTIVGGIDVKRNFFGNYQVFSHVKKGSVGIDPVKYAMELQTLGVGEIFVNNVDNDGVMKGYDLALIEKITHAVDVPVIACGGAGSLADIEKVVREAGAAAAAAGSFFVYHGKHRAVLITYPDYGALTKIFGEQV